MTPESQRLALAKWAGWKFIEHRIGSDIVDVASFPWACLSGMNPKDDTMDGLPDYLHDLNAVAQLEERLDAKEARVFGEQLCKVMTPHSANWGFILYSKYPWTGFDVYTLAHATAAQRCEALLRTLGLWEN